MDRFTAPRCLTLCLMALFVSVHSPRDAHGAETDVQGSGWAQTMLTVRAEHRAALVRAGAAPAGFRPFISGAVAGNGPGQAMSVDVRGVKVLRLQTSHTGGGNIQVWGEARLIAADGSVMRLSSLGPLSARVGWGQLHTDRNWQNNPLRIGDKTFVHGLWVHSESDVCYAIDGAYERFEAWIGMDSSRPVGEAQFKVMAGLADTIPDAWKQIAKDFPVQAKWLREDLGANKETDWFHSANPEREQAMIGRVLGQIGGHAKGMKVELEALKKDKAAADDARWLELYGRACRVRDAGKSIAAIATPALKAAVEKRLAGMVEKKIDADHADWQKLETLAKNAAGDGSRLAVDSLRSSITAMAKAWPGRFQGAEASLARAAGFEARWAKLVAAGDRADEQAMADLSSLQADAVAFRRELMLAVDGMREFLAAWPMVDLEKDWASQFEVLEHDVRQRGTFQKVAAETYRPEALILDADRDPADIVLRRVAALLADLKRTAPSAELDALGSQLAALQHAGGQITPADLDARYVLYAEASRLRRQIAFRNPLANFDELLFIKRHRAIYPHMCDQYYGMAQRPGGGVFVMSNPFRGDSALRDVLADSVVGNGRLKGQKLSGGPNKEWKITFDGMGNLKGDETEGGSFLSPDLSYDGKSILFAYVECTGDREHRHHVDHTKGHWAEGRCYHIFKANVDGTDLRQLTDGTWNDFDPCFLPNGRIAFMSERRGGYLRCGRVCPNYTLYDMAADGSDITALSVHETNEWHPSVTNDGRIIYTRWDYVDRHGCTAHQPWITTLDGRDSRAVHGNFAPRKSRPDMEVDVRAIPGSLKYLSTAAPHHGQAFGSLVMIDPLVEDDDGMGPLKRITPDVAFPETQGGTEAYGTAWPLSEDYYLCVYDAGMSIRKPGAKGHYGIYLLDAFGNRELIYRDETIGCLSPMPLRPRPMPTATPVMAQPTRNAPGTQQQVEGQAPAEGTVIVVDTYASRRPWPEGTKITALRVLQVLPMSVPSGSPPHDTGFRIIGAGDSVVPVRYVLGTVPVEEDGSAHFTAPAGRSIFFQALDEKGLAVQSMRSATYLHGGDRLTCQGCHEPGQSTPPLSAGVPLALKRPASKLKADVDGSNPFSYPRLVQPVLDRHCVSCHSQNAGKAPNLGRDPIERKWYASYRSLVPKYAFTNYGNDQYTVPGQFGARASKLYQMLEQGHHDLKLPAEDLHRIALWLDCASMFYGVYEKEGAEAQLRGEVARPTLE